VIGTDRWRSEAPCVRQGGPHGQTESGGITVICWSPCAQAAVLPDRALCLPTFSHCMIVNQTSLSLSPSLALSLSRISLFQLPPSALSQAIITGKVERREGGVEARCLCQCPPFGLSQSIVVEVERRKGGVEAQFLRQRPPSAFLDVIPFQMQFNQGCRQEACWPPPGSCPPHAAVLEAQQSYLAPRVQLLKSFKILRFPELISVPHTHNRICLFLDVRRSAIWTIFVSKFWRSAIWTIFRILWILPVAEEQSQTRVKAAALRINLNVEGCGIVAAPVHAPSRAPLLLPLLLSHNLPLPRVH
jgi:hypothetical protein